MYKIWCIVLQYIIGMYVHISRGYSDQKKILSEAANDEYGNIPMICNVLSDIQEISIVCKFIYGIQDVSVV